MRKNEFCEAAAVLREYGLWENKAYNIGFSLLDTPASDLASYFYLLMVDGNPDYDYDIKLDKSWIIAATTDEDFFHIYSEYKRHDRVWRIVNFEALYDFLEYMNEHGWED